MKRAMSAAGLVSSLVLAGALAGVAGCSAASTGDVATPTGETPAAAQAATRVAAVAPNAKSGRVRMIADILSTVALTDDQRTSIEALASDAEARHQTEMQAHKDVLTALAAQVEAGKIDRTALRPKLDAASSAMSANHAADHAAIQKLHDLLTPAQRGQVADALEARHKDMAQNHPRQAHRDRLTKLAADLNLTDAQKAQVAAAFASHHGDHASDFRAMHEGMGPHGQRFAEAFRADTLTFPEPGDGKGHAGKMGDHFVTMAETILPILTPEQRTLAAAKLRAHAGGNAPAPGMDEGPLGE